jgi:hypothetical protein
MTKITHNLISTIVVTYSQFDSNIRVLYVFLGFLKNTWYKGQFSSLCIIIMFLKNTWKYFFLSTFEKYSYFICHYYDINPILNLKLRKSFSKNPTNQGFSNRQKLTLVSFKYFVNFFLTNFFNIQQPLHHWSKNYQTTLMHTPIHQRLINNTKSRVVGNVVWEI